MDSRDQSQRTENSASNLENLTSSPASRAEPGSSSNMTNESTTAGNESPFSLIQGNTFSRALRTDDDFEKRYNFGLIGARHVGKTALIAKACTDDFPTVYYHTAGEAQSDLHLKIQEKKFWICLFDAGANLKPDERLTPHLTIAMDGYAIVFNVGCADSFEYAKRIHDNLMNTLMLTAKKGTLEMPRVLLGNWKDVKENERQVTYEEAKEYANEWKIPYLESCAIERIDSIKIWTKLIQHCELNERLRSTHEGSMFIARETRKQMREGSDS